MIQMVTAWSGIDAASSQTLKMGNEGKAKNKLLYSHSLRSNESSPADFVGENNSPE